jgi:hypothetical protein
MGIRFDDIESGEQIILNEWLLHASLEAQELKRKGVEPPGSRKRQIAFAVCVVVLAVIAAATFLWLGGLH